MNLRRIIGYLDKFLDSLEAPKPAALSETPALTRLLKDLDNGAPELNFGYEIDSLAALDKLSKHMVDNKTLRSLQIYGFKKNISSLTSALERNETLLRLSLPGLSLDYLSSFALERLLKFNRTLRRLDLTTHNMSEDAFRTVARGLQKNHGISVVDLTHNVFTHANTVKEIAGIIEHNKTLTVLKMPIYVTAGNNLRPMIKAMKYNVSLIDGPEDPELKALCSANREKAFELIQKTRPNCKNISAKVFNEIRLRRYAIVRLAFELYPEEHALEILKSLQRRAVTLETEFSLPQEYQEAIGMPQIQGQKVDFNKISDPTHIYNLCAVRADLKSWRFQPLLEEMPVFYNAIAMGQIDELFNYLTKNDVRLTSTDLLSQFHSGQSSPLEMIIRQGKLASLMRFENWTHDPEGLQKIYAAIPEGVWEKQVPTLSYKTLLHVVSPLKPKTVLKSQNQKPAPF